MGTIHSAASGAHFSLSESGLSSVQGPLLCANFYSEVWRTPWDSMAAGVEQIGKLSASGVGVGHPKGILGLHRQLRAIRLHPKEAEKVEDPGGSLTDGRCCSRAISENTGLRVWHQSPPQEGAPEPSKETAWFSHLITHLVKVGQNQSLGILREEQHPDLISPHTSHPVRTEFLTP